MDTIIDIGASQIRFGVSADDVVQPLIIVSTPTTQSEIVDCICEKVVTINSMFTQQNIHRLLIGCPGLITGLGRVEFSLHIALSDCDLQGILQARFNCPVMVINDAKAQAVGCATDSESLTYIVIGTGVGGAQLDNGRLIVGSRGFAGEIGHIPVPGSEVLCVCGKRGCLDASASGWSISKELGREWWSVPLNPRAMEVLERAGTHIGIAATLSGVMFDPSRIVIAGHLTKYTQFTEAVLREWHKHQWASAAVEFFPDTWAFSRLGLIRLSLQKMEDFHE